MISNISLVTIWVTDQDEARDFYVDKLGFRQTADIDVGEGFRWVTVSHPSQPELEVTLMRPGPPLGEDLAAAVSRALASGTMAGFALSTPDCQQAYEELVAKGVEFVQPPADRPYGTEALMRDSSGNWLSLVQRKEHSQADFDAVGENPEFVRAHGE